VYALLDWRAFLIDVLGANPAPAGEVFTDLTRRYGEPTRHYHTLAHIESVLRAVDWLTRELTWNLSGVLYLAAWLHDVIYDPRASDNEERSAEYARWVIKQMGLSREIREETARLILLTKAHETSADDRDGQILLDADLAILERFLARPRLYFTEAMFTRAEVRARANLAREIAALAR